MLNINELNISNRAKFLAIASTLNYYNTSIIREYDMIAHNVYYSTCTKFDINDLESAICSLRSSRLIVKTNMRSIRDINDKFINKAYDQLLDVSIVLRSQIRFLELICDLICTTDKNDLVSYHFEKIRSQIENLEHDREKIFSVQLNRL